MGNFKDSALHHMRTSGSESHDVGLGVAAKKQSETVFNHRMG